MSQVVFLVHWNEAEAAVFADGLRRTGWTVEVEAKDGAEAYRRIRSSPPAALVVYLTRLPSHGIKTAAALQMSVLTRTIPTFIVGGSVDAVGKARARLPGARFVAPGELQEALQRLTSDAV